MNQFEGFGEVPESCAVCEAMLPEAVDGTLTADEQRVFDVHVAGCTHCTQELAEAQRGAAWLSMLKSKTPEPPVGLLERILAETYGRGRCDRLPRPERLLRHRCAMKPLYWGTQSAVRRRVAGAAAGLRRG